MKESKSDIGFFAGLTIVLIVLKLAGIISCSWVFVLTPLWLGVAVYLLGLAISLLYSMVRKIFYRRRKVDR